MLIFGLMTFKDIATGNSYIIMGTHSSELTNCKSRALRQYIFRFSWYAAVLALMHPLACSGPDGLGRARVSTQTYCGSTFTPQRSCVVVLHTDASTRC